VATNIARHEAAEFARLCAGEGTTIAAVLRAYVRSRIAGIEAGGGRSA
jgi:hypothetical protein